jgi:hypothetical protein
MNEETGARKIGEVAASVASQCNLPREPDPSPILYPEQVPAAFICETDRNIPDRVVSWYQGFANPTPILRRALMPDERAALVRRRRDLMAATMPPPNGHFDDNCAIAVMRMLGAFPQSHRHNDENAIVIARGYLWVVREKPPWAIIAACRAVRLGMSGLNMSFCPSEPEFHAVVAKIVAPYEAQLRKIDLIVRATVTVDNGRFARKAATPEAARQISDGKYAERALADLAARKAQQAAQIEEAGR